MEMLMIALVVAEMPVYGFSVVSSLGAAGIRCDVVATHRRSLCRWSRYCRRFYPVSSDRLLRQDPKLAAEICELGRSRRVDIIVPADLESGLLLTTHRALFEERMLFPLAPPELLLRLHNKSSFAKALTEAGVEQPRTMVLESAEHLPDLDLQYPVVLKPLAASGGEGVWVAESREAVVAYLASERCELPRLVQEFIPGGDVDLTVLADHGRILAWVVQRRLPGGLMEFFHDDAVLETGRRIVQHTGYHGIADFDLRLDKRDGRIKMIECNPRFPGSLRFKTWAGVNLPHLGVMLGKGQSAPEPFVEPSGRCTDVAVSPRKLLSALAHGRLAPANLTEYTRRCWMMNLRDPLAHAIRGWQARQASRPVLAADGIFRDPDAVSQREGFSAGTQPAQSGRPETAARPT
jgi:predicted ATP-grasp superfamily ATP-dependent carboligase